MEIPDRGCSHKKTCSCFHVSQARMVKTMCGRMSHKKNMSHHQVNQYVCVLLIKFVTVNNFVTFLVAFRHEPCEFKQTSTYVNLFPRHT